jgi:pimeloyl-ACP methyl ester carboxylesterase
MSGTSRHALTTDVVHGINLLVRAGDATRTIVFLHGVGGRATSFADVFQRWPDGPRLIAWDAPGYGPSKAINKPWATAKDYAAVLRLVFDGLGLERADVVAQSLGCIIAGSFSTRHKERVRRLVLIAPAHGYRMPTDQLTPALTQRAADFTREGAAAFATKRAPRLVHAADRKPEVVAAVRDVMATLTDPGHTDAVRVLAGGDLPTHLARSTQPTLLISGADDQVTPLSGTRELLTVLQQRSLAQGGHADLVVIPDAGHAVYLEAPDAVVGAIASFLGGAS